MEGKGKEKERKTSDISSHIKYFNVLERPEVTHGGGREGGEMEVGKQEGEYRRRGEAWGRRDLGALLRVTSPTGREIKETAGRRVCLSWLLPLPIPSPPPLSLPPSTRDAGEHTHLHPPPHASPPRAPLRQGSILGLAGQVGCPGRVRDVTWPPRRSSASHLTNSVA